MSHVIKSFCTINTMLDGTLGNTAPLGELSPYSRTFSTRKTEIADPLYESVSVTIFSCQEANVDVSLPINVDGHLLGLMEDIVTNFTSAIPFEDQLASRHPELTLISMGPLVSYSGKTYPGSFSYETNISGEPIISTIWLADAVFRDEYDEYEIRVVPPIPNVADLQNDYTTVLDLVTAYGVPEQIAAQEAARGSDPATKIATLELNWVDSDTGNTLALTWVLVTFGPKGLVYENQIEAIRQYLLDETGQIPEQWADTFPDLIISISLTFIPLWDKIALRSSGSVQYVHSPVFGKADIDAAVAKRFTNSITDDLADKILALTIGYKSLSMVVFPDGSNATLDAFTDIYPDYAIIPINDININRISANTRDAMAAIEAAVRLAEEDTGTQTLPAGTQREIIEGRTYLIYTVNGIKHRVMTSASYLT